MTVYLHRNLNRNQYMFALGIDPTTAVKLLDRIASRRIGKGQFFVQKLGQYWMQINSTSYSGH